VAQLEQLQIPFQNHFKNSDLILDAVFGFSFTGPIRPPFDALLSVMIHSTCPIISIDIPSGWHVEQGPHPNDIQPEMLISLTFPKECAKYFKGKHHFLGGRFIPPSLSKKYGFSVPEFPGSAQCVRLY
jgi:NAD(P)H-hydrate epimerase